MNKLILVLFIVLMFCVVLAVPVHAMETFGFYRITNNDPANAGLGEAQLSVDVLDTDDSTNVNLGQVGFKFYHADLGVATTPMTIAEIYFDDGSLFGIADIYSSSGVTFVKDEEEGENGTNPKKLPDGETLVPPFETTAGFSAEAAGNNGTGVDAGANEWVEIVFGLIDTKTYSDTLAALHRGYAGNYTLDENGDAYLDGNLVDVLRIGLHVTSIGANEESESYVNNIPAPGALLLGSMGVGLVGWLRRRRTL